MKNKEEKEKSFKEVAEEFKEMISSVLEVPSHALYGKSKVEEALPLLTKEDEIYISKELEKAYKSYDTYLEKKNFWIDELFKNIEPHLKKYYYTNEYSEKALKNASLWVELEDIEPHLKKNATALVEEKVVVKEKEKPLYHIWQE